MKKNGFTLIELLAVIVILAIIALIATPIILGIINDAREKANERSVELYASAVKNGIAAYQLREGKEVQVGQYTTETLPFEIEYDGDVDCTTIELYDNGRVYVTGCTVNEVTVEYVYGTRQVIKGLMNSVCNPLDVQIEGAYTEGDKYECDVDQNKEGYDYTFYVLSSTATEVNLIMDSNINENGEAVKEGVTDLGLVAWYGDHANSSFGPITAMNFLTEATAGWTNTNKLTISTFTDDAGETRNMAETFTSNARMPYLSEVREYDGTNAHLYNNTKARCRDDEENEVSCDVATEIDGVHEEGMTHVSYVNGYWILAASNDVEASSVDCYGYLGSVFTDDGGYYGVRPVINLSI